MFSTTVRLWSRRIETPVVKVLTFVVRILIKEGGVMALVNHNVTLEYAANTLEFRLFDDLGEPSEFGSDTSFHIERIDNPLIKYSVTVGIDTGCMLLSTLDSNGDSKNNIVRFVVNPSLALSNPSDSLYDYSNPEYNHIYSIKSTLNSQVYVSGMMNLVEVAG